MATQALTLALGKPPASNDLKRALDVDMYNALKSVSTAPPVQSVAAFLTDKQNGAHLGRDLLQRPVCVTSIGTPDVTPSWVPFLNAFFDVSSFHSATIPAFAAHRVRMLQCPVPGQPSLPALNVQNVVDAAARHGPPGSSSIVVLTSFALRHVDENRQSAACMSVADGKLVVVLSMAQSSAVPPSPHPVVHAMLHAVGVHPCSFFECAMNACSNGSPSLVLCPLCLRKCSLVVPQFNIVRRYEALLAILEGWCACDGGWVESFHRWCADHIAYITNTPRPSKRAMDAVDVSKLTLLKRRLAARKQR
ncbi:hypothetical protein H310_03636 [Aphanomyces invadans]|uniref:Uncharacterized protein n=1 Tax=Aphanomyces invadans TaxID=157072 RepID=A0A024UJJ3_9STRA|nr:hypothetical protein H310_03636 [Aphanomyces invadans]ETW06027.1 hypothetical protein H310_03636 [Aphanomyces invadans]|eukprot:XP_008865804.1 hypothetical protein H310_03636 [Aphanomyces invadans]